MLDSFWDSVEIEEISDLNYTDTLPYTSSEQKESVLEKIDWIILKLHKMRDIRKYDYGIITKMKNKIRLHDCSLTKKGVDYQNLVSNELKEDVF